MPIKVYTKLISLRFLELELCDEDTFRHPTAASNQRKEATNEVHVSLSSVRICMSTIFITRNQYFSLLITFSKETWLFIIIFRRQLKLPLVSWKRPQSIF